MGVLYCSRESCERIRCDRDPYARRAATAEYEERLDHDEVLEKAPAAYQVKVVLHLLPKQDLLLTFLSMQAITVDKVSRTNLACITYALIESPDIRGDRADEQNHIDDKHTVVTIRLSPPATAAATHEYLKKCTLDEKEAT